MRYVSFRLGAVALAVSIAFAGCGGRGMVPSQNGPALSPMQDALVPDATNPCANTNNYTFLGACKSGYVTASGGTYALPAYKGVTFKAVLGKNNAAGKVPFVFGDAMTLADIKGTRNGKPFPAYSAKTCQKGGSCPGAAAVYVMINNKGKKVISFTSPTTLVVTDAKFPGTTCFPAILYSTGWAGFSHTTTGRVSGGKVTITIPPNPLFTIAVGVGFLAIACD